MEMVGKNLTIRIEADRVKERKPWTLPFQLSPTHKNTLIQKNK